MNTDTIVRLTICALFFLVILYVFYRKKIPLTYSLILLPILLLGLTVLLDIPDINNILSFTLVAVTAIYVIFTGQQVTKTEQIITETKQQRLAASQPIILIKYVQQITTLTTALDTFVFWNAGNGPAIEVNYILLGENKNLLEANRETFLKSGDDYRYYVSNNRLIAGNNFIVCEFKRIDSIAGIEIFDQTWLPFKVEYGSKPNNPIIVLGELSFRFDIKDNEKIQDFNAKPKSNLLTS